jgi:hypothetical protein
MQAITAGHLSSNGGIRGHSAGDFYPYRVMIRGTLDNLKYIVIAPTGSYISGWKTSKAACAMARIFKEMDDIGL